MSKASNRRARRRARALVREARPGIVPAHNSHTVPARDFSPSLHAQAVRESPRYRKAGISAPQAERSYQELQVLTARGTGEHTRGKRTVRYTAVTPWRGTRSGYADDRNAGVRILPAKRRKGQ